MTGGAERGLMPAVLRQMTVDDLPAVMEIERSTFPFDAWTEGMMRGELADQPRTRHYLVAEADGRIVGYAGLAVAADQADVQTIAVDERYRRRGIGAALLEALLAEAARRGATAVFLEVRADNAPAQAMYERFGFERIGLRRRYYHDGTDAITMVKRLDEREGRWP
ncbi:ribosomal-protein-alanine acetyltransferase [Thermobispora bispora]|uniref:Ribosomal-protein-alanine acetyltransferase n=1 Tax=Thermobispora bispora (strain ATCC 19993 / DSM 43833 / CBS 139.67 / JCM 10125 / KCTC 9307 / NBRC 14880 / R51) TaxID=469371 RepID=D6Y567_THEBD|nr:ribosomal protein S18-alanine N-acetyltransferase [Thermobispora bispora]ADG87342.1 ribosomal-protein-alanine acetyltransferase [Thermobispora bispora DSM 43833]MDI9580154.1 ribosomal protein S18-alanine N-acetyltransferase [Thermobispora sp.]